MTKKTIGTIVVSILIMLAVLAVVAVVRSWRGDDPIAFTATVGDKFKLHVENYSDTTLIVNHITVVTSGGAIIHEEDIRVTDGYLYVNAPIIWRHGEEVTVLVGCTYGSVNFVRQVARFL